MRVTPSVAMGFFMAGICVLASCKGVPEKTPSVHRAPPASGPSAEDMAREKREARLKKLITMPVLGVGVNYKAPDGEVWTKYDIGIMTHDLVPKPGAATPGFGQTVTIAYKGMLPGGGPGHEAIFDRTKPDAPLVFELGTKDLIRGLSIGLENMNLGSTRRIYIPPELAYGTEGKRPSIPPNQPLIFEVTLVEITGQKLDPEVPVKVNAEPIGPTPPPGLVNPASKP